MGALSGDRCLLLCSPSDDAVDDNVDSEMETLVTVPGDHLRCVGRYQRELILWQAGECPVDLLDAFTAASLVTALGAPNVVLPSGSGNQ